MATFKEEFKKQRALKGSGATFEWNGGTYSTDTADGKKASPAQPAARPAGLNPKSGASRSTAGKVAPKPADKPKDKSKAMSSASVRPEGKAAAMPKAKPAMSMMDKAKAEATARREKTKPKTPAAPAKSDAAYASKIGPKKESAFERMKRALMTKGGISKFKG